MDNIMAITVIMGCCGYHGSLQLLWVTHLRVPDTEGIGTPSSTLWDQMSSDLQLCWQVSLLMFVVVAAVPAY